MAGTGKAKVSDNGSCAVVVCDCISEYQDNQYGAQRRLANKGNSKVTCTVCGKAHK